ncbi:MAG: Nif3-like dinuclear metal center hexameric protein [Clostridia bacterium]|nr:Nif3-like dinuclear metal center hexameric protein [Clostridia bacterium]
MKYLINDAIKIIEEFAPLSLQLEYDNCGVKTGNIYDELKGILVSLDTNEAVVDEAIDNNCNLIIEHHPSIFKSIKNLNFQKSTNRALIKAAANNIVIYSAHTNVDFTENGLNDYVSRIMGLKNVHKISTPDSPRIGEVEHETNLREYLNFLKVVFNDVNAYSVGDMEKSIKYVAVINGGGGSNEDDLILSFNNGADVYVSGDFKYNVLRLAKDNQYAIISIGHFNTEIYFIDLVTDLLKNKLESFNKIFKTKKLLNPCN